MHEMAVTENILRIVLTQAESAGVSRVTKIGLVIGELSSIIDESVQMYFSLLSENTIAADAVLEFKHIPATLKCINCGHTFPKKDHHFTCPQCGGNSRFTGDAKEFYIEAIEVE